MNLMGLYHYFSLLQMTHASMYEVVMTTNPISEMRYD
jgi:hypothetical protein